MNEYGFLVPPDIQERVLESLLSNEVIRGKAVQIYTNVTYSGVIHCEQCDYSISLYGLIGNSVCCDQCGFENSLGFKALYDFSVQRGTIDPNVQSLSQFTKEIKERQKKWTVFDADFKIEIQNRFMKPNENNYTDQTI